ncbi:MAG: hypothetical protein U5L09_04215 [Bacteroidales bacterium]|nr:hypothetical protein [Bacteroidales bacterium]
MKPGKGEVVREGKTSRLSPSDIPGISALEAAKELRTGAHRRYSI